MKGTLVVCKPRLPEVYDRQSRMLAGELVGLDSVQTVFWPMFELVPRDGEIMRVHRWMHSQSGKAIVIFVSPSVLEMVMRQVNPWPSNVYCGVMGQQSAVLAQELGVPKSNILAPGVNAEDASEDSEGLARMLDAHFLNKSLPVLICKGPRGRTDFPVRLSQLGFAVESSECYERNPIERKATEFETLLNAPKPLFVWITSSETMQQLDTQFSCLSPEQGRRLKEHLQVLVTHPRIAGKARDLGYSSVYEIPTGIQSLRNWINIYKNNMSESQSQPQSQPQSQGGSDVPTVTDYRTTKAQLPPTHSMTSAAASSAPVPSWMSKAALLMSLISLTLVVLMVVAGKNQIEKTRLAFAERLQKDSTTVDLMKEQVTQNTDLLRDLKTRYELMEESQKELSSQRANLEEVYNKLLAGRAEVSLTEIEQLISIAKRQLVLLGNLNGAAAALEQVLELLERTDKPSLLSLKAAVETDLRQVKSLPKQDLLGMAIQLDSVITSIDSLPTLAGADAQSDTDLAQMTDEASLGDSKAGSSEGQSQKVAQGDGAPSNAATPNDRGVALANTAEPQSSDFWGSVWRSIGSGLKAGWREVKSLIAVTRVESPEILLISARQEADLRNTLRLSLLNARISLLSRHAELLKSDLKRSKDLLNKYFDPKSPSVQRALAVSADLEKVQLDMVLPELQATTAAFRLAVASQKGARP